MLLRNNTTRLLERLNTSSWFALAIVELQSYKEKLIRRLRTVLSVYMIDVA